MARRLVLGLGILGSATLVVAACGGGGSADLPAAITSATTEPTTPSASRPEPTEPATPIWPEDLPECDTSVENITFGSSNQGTIAKGEVLVFCVDVPTDVTSFSVTLTDLTTNLDLATGYPDLEMLRDGGVGLRFSFSPGTADETIGIDLDPDRFFKPGSYYIEVNAFEADEASTFTLSVGSP